MTQNYLSLTVLGFIAAYVVNRRVSHFPGATIATLDGRVPVRDLSGRVVQRHRPPRLGAIGNLSWRPAGDSAIAWQQQNGRTGLGSVKTIKDGIDENQWSMLFLIRLDPSGSFLRGKPWCLRWSMFRCAALQFRHSLGIIPGAQLSIPLLGQVWARFLPAAKHLTLGIIFEPHILLPILGLCALALLPVILKAVRGKRRAVRYGTTLKLTY